MPDYGVSDTEREILLKLDQILEAVRDLQARQKEIRGLEQEQKQGSFASP